MGMNGSGNPQEKSMPLKPSREFGGRAMVDGTLMAQADHLISRIVSENGVNPPMAVLLPQG